MSISENNQIKTNGYIEVICGSMFSGKTKELICRLENAQQNNQRVVCFKPDIDTRYDKSNIVSHDNKKFKSISIKKSEEILNMVKNYDVIGIDEAQFFDDEIVNVCNALANKGVRVIVAGLDMDFKGNPFGPMPNLMATAEYVTKVHAVCTHTGNLAQYSYRKSKNDNLVLLGEVDEYEPLSRAAYYKALTKEKVKAIDVENPIDVGAHKKNSNA